MAVAPGFRELQARVQESKHTNQGLVAQGSGAKGFARHSFHLGSMQLGSGNAGVPGQLMTRCFGGFWEHAEAAQQAIGATTKMDTAVLYCRSCWGSHGSYVCLVWSICLGFALSTHLSGSVQSEVSRVRISKGCLSGL